MKKMNELILTYILFNILINQMINIISQHPYTKIYSHSVTSKYTHDENKFVPIQYKTIESIKPNFVLKLIDHVLLNKKIGQDEYMISHNDAIKIVNMCIEIINKIMIGGYTHNDILSEYDLPILL